MEQTVAAINGMSSSIPGIQINWSDELALWFDHIRIQANDCRLRYSYNYYTTIRGYGDRVGTATISGTVDLSTVEEFSVMRLGQPDSRQSSYFALLPMRSGEIMIGNGTIDVMGSGSDLGIILGLFNSSSTDASVHDVQLVRAIKRLRVLCGAPDPVRF